MTPLRVQPGRAQCEPRRGDEALALCEGSEASRRGPTGAEESSGGEDGASECRRHSEDEVVCSLQKVPIPE